MGRWRGENRGSGMTVTITATMDSLLLRFFCYVFTLNPSQIKKKLDYICLVAWFMFQMVMFLRRLNSYIFTQNNNYNGIGIVFFLREHLAEMSPREMFKEQVTNPHCSCLQLLSLWFSSSSYCVTFYIFPYTRRKGGSFLFNVSV